MLILSRLLILIFVLTGCASKRNLEQERKETLVTFNLRSFDIVQNGQGWSACDSEYLKASKLNLLELKTRVLSSEEKEVCALFLCEKNNCIQKGSYSTFSQVAELIFQSQKRKRFTSKPEEQVYDVATVSGDCFQGQQVNSCAVLSAHYRYLEYDRSRFFEVRQKECELLGISQKNCSFDL